MTTHTVTRTVSPTDTARAVGSGDLDVLGTPVLLAWCEAATCAALDLAPDQTSVGTRVEIAHVAASAIGAEVSATAEVEHLDERRARFTVTAIDGSGTEVARGIIERAIVDRERFLSRL
ncbi:thioesterase family protein [Aeromicrobium sp. CF3.5]|uniref:thioesterase family protein n=1 Tax=Aeromicrobium sp. CF3.5 TaxID=3373078 RepID=UPI003EE5DB93